MKDITTEATTGGVFSKKVFLQISQNSPEKASARVSFLLKLQAGKFLRTPPEAASVTKIFSYCGKLAIHYQTAFHKN